ncbi:rab9 effector protein with kelch motifs isoform X12 [Rattus norvegicus]|uniref:rab9 effector protein with kelch motifs isoform X12 n=1 Tax=Rattus norvegicus TaxID=10116 RepID=UPI0003D0C337|nr:rab9 effector protein with kelch motifs isoform X10 [Rattus norvegicus]
MPTCTQFQAALTNLGTMKQLPILEPGDKPRKAAWSVHSDLPWRQALPSSWPQLLVFSPSWRGREREGLHCRGSKSKPKLLRCTHHGFGIWVFGGADQSGNRNCLQVMNPEARTWSTPEVTGCPPSPRTFHTSSAAIGNHLYVFGGGERGAQPVQDVKLHVFDANTLTWAQPETHGSPPSPRHGHAMVAAGTKLFIHGGLAGDRFFDDLHCIDIGDMSWQKLGPTGTAPVGCAAHAAVAVGHHVYVFGGMTATGALNTMYKYHTEKQHWTILQFDTSLPPGRLDHSMCVIPWPVMSASDTEDSGSVILSLQDEKGDAAEKPETRSGGSREESPTTLLLCFVFGGMNTEGEIYDDCLVTVVD